MLSAESSVGRYPVEAVSMMRKIVLAAQDHEEATALPFQVPFAHPRTAAAIAGAIRQIMAIQDISAVVVFTTSGTTARLLAKNRPACPIVALTSDLRTVRRCGLYYGVVPRRIDAPASVDELLDAASRRVKDLQMARPGDHIIVLAGHTLDTQEGANGLIIERVE
jgi:pyruvate kinase